MTASAQTVRKLGASEYLVYLLNQRLVRLIEFDGMVQPELMERAFRQMIARRPILRVRVPSAPPGERPHFVADESTPAPFTVVPRTDPQRWVEAFHHELNSEFDLSAGPPVRAQLVCSDQPGGELIVSCLHIACDGRSLFQFCSQLLSEYEALARGDATDVTIPDGVFQPAVEDLLPDWATPEKGAELVENQLAKQAALPAPMPWPSDRGDSTESKCTHMLPYDVPSDQVAAMRDNARRHDTTVHGILGAAQALAIQDVLKPEPDDQIVITTTLDIRDGLCKPVAREDMGIYAATLPSRHSDISKLDPWDVARDLKNQVSEGMAANEHYTFIFIGEKFVENLTASAGDPMMTGSIANLGMMTLPVEGTSLRVRAFRGALDIHPPAWPFISLNAVGINGHLAMTAAYANPEIGDWRATAFVDAMCERMRWFAR